PQLVEVANLVTEMRMIKHPYQQGITSRRGIDY
ncbi:MAG: cob(I)yrinic acid a,c-diamide adenosyltransferase, partial [Chloroflexi bacterium]|nr:cob(I)yrinic acid a,c-diamide adenosyltransferase [Chloroflexota bacterium]